MSGTKPTPAEFVQNLLNAELFELAQEARDWQVPFVPAGAKLVEFAKELQRKTNLPVAGDELAQVAVQLVLLEVCNRWLAEGL